MARQSLAHSRTGPAPLTWRLQQHTHHSACMFIRTRSMHIMAVRRRPDAPHICSTTRLHLWRSCGTQGLPLARRASGRYVLVVDATEDTAAGAAELQVISKASSIAHITVAPAMLQMQPSNYSSTVVFAGLRMSRR